MTQQQRETWLLDLGVSKMLVNEVTDEAPNATEEHE